MLLDKLSKCSESNVLPSIQLKAIADIFRYSIDESSIYSNLDATDIRILVETVTLAYLSKHNPELTDLKQSIVGDFDTDGIDLIIRLLRIFNSESEDRNVLRQSLSEIKHSDHLFFHIANRAIRTDSITNRAAFFIDSLYWYLCGTPVTITPIVRETVARFQFNVLFKPAWCDITHEYAADALHANAYFGSTVRELIHRYPNQPLNWYTNQLCVAYLYCISILIARSSVLYNDNCKVSNKLQTSILQTVHHLLYT